MKVSVLKCGEKYVKWFHIRKNNEIEVCLTYDVKSALQNPTQDIINIMKNYHLEYIDNE